MNISKKSTIHVIFDLPYSHHPLLGFQLPWNPAASFTSIVLENNNNNNKNKNSSVSATGGIKNICGWVSFPKVSSPLYSSSNFLGMPHFWRLVHLVWLMFLCTNIPLPRVFVKKVSVAIVLHYSSVKQWPYETNRKEADHELQRKIRVRRCPQVALEIFQHISGTWRGTYFQFLDYIFGMCSYEKGRWGAHGSDIRSRTNYRNCPLSRSMLDLLAKALNMLLYICKRNHRTLSQTIDGW